MLDPTISIPSAMITSSIRVDGVSDIDKRLRVIEERLAIIQPNVEKHEKWPALKDAYDNFKMIEKLIGE